MFSTRFELRTFRMQLEDTLPRPCRLATALIPQHTGTILSLLLVPALLNLPALNLTAQTTAPAVKPSTAPSAATAIAGKPSVAGTGTRFQPSLMPRRAALYYDSVWGVDTLNVKVAESGELIRFSWRVLDPAKAMTLSDKKLEPALIAPASHVKLVIPSLEKVGQLRQTSTPEVGKSYWMAFSNPGRLVKQGDRVDISIGTFRVEGITVE